MLVSLIEQLHGYHTASLHWAETKNILTKCDT